MTTRSSCSPCRSALVRRAVLEVGRRLAARGRLHDEADAFEASVAELRAVLTGAGPPATVLAARRAERLEAARLTPPPGWATASPPAARRSVPRPPAASARCTTLVGGGRCWSPRAGEAAATVGTEVVRGRALVADDPVDALNRLAPGDVLVTDTTHAAWNVVFPLVAAVAVEHGGPMGHAAILARELGLTAVIGVPGSARPGARRRSGGGRPDRRHHHRAPASHLRVTPA